MFSRRGSAAVPSVREPKTAPPPNPHANRETVESIVVAVILAFLFRGFIAEAFVIPTGSMAPTLVGSHKDIDCPKCGYQYRASASVENDEGEGTPGMVIATTCPLCRYMLEIDNDNPHDWSFSGDRILVSKFSYNLSEPKRWDVIVFKYPGNAKQNYIKRLIGLPNETIRVHHGDIFIKPAGASEFSIARKPDHRLRSLLHVVDDTRHIPQEFSQLDWPARWAPDGRTWEASARGGPFVVRETGGRDAWIRYRHVVPSYEDWELMSKGETPPGSREKVAQLITDFYGYNGYEAEPPTEQGWLIKTTGCHWVGDLAVECDLNVEGERGEVLLDLVEAGVHYTCRIQVADGTAVLQINGRSSGFVNGQGEPMDAPQATTALRGSGKYQVRFANVDDELRLWIDDREVEFNRPAYYQRTTANVPHWTAEDPGDLSPVGVGSRDAQLQVHRLRVLRDVYYVAAESNLNYDYDEWSEQTVYNVLMNPHTWATTDLFAKRRQIEFTLGPDQFFPLGDNSPQSKDARIWGERSGWYSIPSYVDRSLLTGEALLIYWPHAWYTPFRIYVPKRFNRPFGEWEPFPMTPNLERMGLIH